MKDEILFEISEYCQICPLCYKCIEEDCVLFRIEQLVLEGIGENEK